MCSLVEYNWLYLHIHLIAGEKKKSMALAWWPVGLALFSEVGEGATTHLPPWPGPVQDTTPAWAQWLCGESESCIKWQKAASRCQVMPSKHLPLCRHLLLPCSSLLLPWAWLHPRTYASERGSVHGSQGCPSCPLGRGRGGKWGDGMLVGWVEGVSLQAEPLLSCSGAWGPLVNGSLGSSGERPLPGGARESRASSDVTRGDAAWGVKAC